MIKCEKCTNKHRRNICKVCDNENNYEERKAKTNGDRIRQMTDIELAMFIKSAQCNLLYSECGYPTCNSMNGYYCFNVSQNANEEVLNWLRSDSLK